MIVYWCGFNGFKQLDNVNIGEVCVPLQMTPLDEIEDIGFSWNCSVIIKGCDAYISGFWGKESFYMKKLPKPNEQVKFLKVACSNIYAIFMTENEECWQYFYYTQSWKKLLNFYSVEELKNSPSNCLCPVALNCDSNCSDKKDEVRQSRHESQRKIIKICCGDIVNIALDNQGIAYSIPSPIILPGVKVLDIACGFEHCLMLDDFGRVFSWGSGMKGQLGREVLETTDIPREVDTLSGLHVVRIAAGGWHSGAVTTSGILYTWGWNNSGQLGFPSVESADSAYSYEFEEKEILDSEATVMYDLQNITDNSELNIRESVDKNATRGQKKTSSHVENLNETNRNIRNKVFSPNDPNDAETREENLKYSNLLEIKGNISFDEKEKTLYSNKCLGKSRTVKTVKVTNSSEISGKSNAHMYVVTVLAVPQAVCFPCEMDVDVVDVSCGNRHTIVSTGDGSVWGCGWNEYGQLGKPLDVLTSTDCMMKLDLLTDNMKITKIHCGGWNTAVFLDR